MHSTLSVEERRRRDDEYQRAYRRKNRLVLAAWQREYYRVCQQRFADEQRWLKAARKKRGYSQATISRLESGAFGLDSFAKKAELMALLGKERDETCISAT